MKTGVELIAQERDEQINKHQRSVALDAGMNQDEELLFASLVIIMGNNYGKTYWPENWDKQVWRKIKDKPRTEQLAIAGALIAAEIDRLQLPNVNKIQDERRQMVTEFAEKLNGREYSREHVVTKDEEIYAKNNGLVVIFGVSDDLMESRGVIDEEYGAYEGGIFYCIKTKKGTFALRMEDELSPDVDVKTLPKLEAVWHNKGDYSWTYQTEIPHATFDIMDEGEKFCRGIVFHVDDLKA